MSTVGLFREFKLTGVVEREPPPIKSRTEAKESVWNRKQNNMVDIKQWQMYNDSTDGTSISAIEQQ